MAIDHPALPRGSTVLVTGAAGWVGSNVADQFLAHGYKVRGTTRDVNKAAWATEAFDAKYGPGLFELVAVPDMAAEGAYDEAVKDTSAVVHTASNMSFDTDPTKVIPGVIDGALNAIKSAYAEPSVKRFVFTSSSSAAVLSIRGKPKVVVKNDTWNEEAVKAAWSSEPYGEERAISVYAASKTQAEQAIWKYHEENRARRPDLVLNTVLPDLVFGKPIYPEKQGYPSTSGTIALLFQGQVASFHKSLDPQYFIGGSDTGRLHVVGAIHPDVKEERIFGFAGRYSWDEVLAILRKNFPGREFPDDFSGGEDPNEIEPRGRSEQLLRDLGRPGFATLEEVILENVEELGKV